MLFLPSIVRIIRPEGRDRWDEEKQYSYIGACKEVGLKVNAEE